MTRSHIHRYDIKLIIKKTRNDEDGEAAIQKTLQRLQEIMLQADPHTIIPPYFELDRSDKAIADLSKDLLISSIESFQNLKTYFSRLNRPNETTGEIYCSAILAQNKPFNEVLDRTLSSLRNQNISIFPRGCDHEVSSDVGWLLYSTRQQDTTRLAELLSELSGDLLGIKWKPIRTTEGFKKRDPTDPQELTRALHIEGPADRAHDIRTKLSQWYSSASNNFPDGTKMRLIPPFSNKNWQL
jgi:hypothetical protein